MPLLYLALALIAFAALAVLAWPVWRAQDIPLPQRKRAVLALAAFFFLGGFGLYQLLGTPEIVPLLKAREEKLAEIKETVLRRSQEVQSDPKNLGAWVELGQSFMEIGQFDGAANAFKQAVLISEGHPAIIMAYAKAQIAAADGKVTDQAKKGLEMVLLQEPENQEARYWLIVRQLQDGRQEDAMRSMKELYRSLPDDSPLKERINRQIGR